MQPIGKHKNFPWLKVICIVYFSLESSAVSVSLSPTSRHLLVGLTSRTSRIISLSPVDRQLMAQVEYFMFICHFLLNMHFRLGFPN